MERCIHLQGPELNYLNLNHGRECKSTLVCVYLCMCVCFTLIEPFYWGVIKAGGSRVVWGGRGHSSDSPLTRHTQTQTQRQSILDGSWPHCGSWHRAPYLVKKAAVTSLPQFLLRLLVCNSQPET